MSGRFKKLWSGMTKKFRKRKEQQTDISESSINQLGVSGNIDARDITQVTTTYNLRGPTNINVNSEDQSRQLTRNLDEPSSSRADDAIVRDLSRRLKELYSDLQLPLVSWMNENDLPLDEYYIPLQLNSVRRASQLDSQSQCSTDEIYSYNDYGLDLDSDSDQDSFIDQLKKAIDLADMFEPVDGVSPKRILIEAQPGFGKTTLAHKIILDWRMEENYAKSFDFGLLVPLRSLKDKTLRELVLERLEEKDNGKVWNLINSDRTLLVLDGLDEVGDSARENILKMLYDKISNKMTIVVTCRTGLFKLDESERNSLFLGVAKPNDFWDKKFEILGFSGKSRKRFLKNFVCSENYNIIVKNLKKMDNQEILRSPLILILFVFIFLDDEKFTIKTQTELYKKLVDYIIKRSVSRDEKAKLGENFTIFDNQNPTDYALYFCKFGELSFDHILNDNLQFECSDLSDFIYRMGFLIKHETVKNKLKVLRHYEGCHLTFLEFAAAFSLWDQYKKNGNEFPTEAIDQINCICLKKSSVSMVLPFLCGLMGDDVKILFDQLLDFQINYSLRYDLISSILRECVISDDVCKIIAQFIPKRIGPNLYKILYLQNENLTMYIVSLDVRCTDLWLLAEDGIVQIDSICVDLCRYTSEDVRVKRYFKNQVSCKNLFINMHDVIDSYQEIADQLYLLLCGVISKYKYLRTTTIYLSGTHTLINECVNNGILKNQTIEYLFYDLISWESAADTVINIIKNNTVKELELRMNFLYVFDNLYKIITIVASSPDILSFELINRRGYSYRRWENKRSPTFARDDLKREMPLIDLSNFLKGGKYWRHIGLQYINTKCNVSLSNSECIDSIEILSQFPDRDVEILRALKPRKLQCDYKLFDRLTLTPNLLLWGGLHSVTKLILQIWKQNGTLERLSHVDKFVNLKEVTLCLMEPLSPEEQREIVKCLPLFTVDQLQFRCEGFVSAIDIVSGVNDLIERRELKSIRSIDFELLPRGSTDITEYLNFIIKIAVVLFNDFNVTVHFINLGEWHLLPIVRTFESSVFSKQYFTRLSFPARHRAGPSWFRAYDNVLKIQKI